MLSKRRMAREMALQMLYQKELGDAELVAVVEEFARRGLAEFRQEGDTSDASLVERAFGYAKILVGGVVERGAEIDELIRAQAENWRLERMPPVDRNILRLAIYEMLCQDDVPQLVIIDEAIELAKKYGSEHSGRFVNGLLDGLIKTRAFPGSLT